MICGALERGMTLAVGTCHSRAGGVNVGLNESSTATSGQDAALYGHQTARQYTILPPFQSFSLPLSSYGCSLRATISCSSSFDLIPAILPSRDGFYFERITLQTKYQGKVFNLKDIHLKTTTQ